ncbi:MAG: SMP-30/gluconolactonase/LRE family protein, partial [Bryobacterales bacterium]|nr:SMP-30/gluconolactonase/LRE family protein [Bryobacterales bacterium]
MKRLITSLFLLPLSMFAEDLFVATPLTAVNSFTAEVEGPACDRAGNIFAVSFERKPTIGRVTPSGKGEVFLEMPNGGLANGIRFDRKGRMYVADYTNHNVLLVNPASRAIRIFAHSAEMNQPNDLA